MKINLLRLKLENFQGGTFQLDTEGTDTDIFGDNGTGKTRLASAFSWLLFGKDSLGRKDFEIKNLDASGEAEHGLDHMVEGVLSIGENIVTLKKVYREKWTKQRGKADAVFTGHTTQHFVNGVPTQEKEYIERVTELTGDENIFRLLTSPTVFPSLQWKKQRDLIIEICGDTKDEDIITSNNKLASLTEIISRRSIDDHRKIITAQKAQINKELEKLPVRIDEQRRSLPDTSGLDKAQLQKDINAIETQLNYAKLKLQGINTGGEIAKLSKELTITNTDILRIAEKHHAETLEAENKLSRSLNETETRVKNSRNRLLNINIVLKHKQEQLKELTNRLLNKRTEWEAKNSEILTDPIPNTCPACNQTLPTEKVRETTEKALADFNNKKATMLAEIQARGKALTEDIDSLSLEIGLIEKEKKEIDNSIPNDDELISKTISEREVIRTAYTNYTSVPAYQELISKKKELELLIKAEKEGRSGDSEATKDNITILETALSNAKEKADRFVKREAGEKRIEELKEEEKKLATEYERLEAELYLTEQFIRTKVNLLTEKINNSFEITRFKLFNTLVNGAIEECCEVTVGGVPFNGGLNSGARTNAGLDVIRTLQNHYGIHPPVIVDNAESVVELLHMDCQVIRLVVSEKDKILRVQKARKEDTL